MTDKLAKYKKMKSTKGNFKVIDTIGVPHPYMITEKHVVHASDNFSGMLGKSAIESAEREGIYCGICKGDLKYDEHKQALLVECKLDFQTDENAKNELHQYLLKLKKFAEKDEFEGFAFKR